MWPFGLWDASMGLRAPRGLPPAPFPIFQPAPLFPEPAFPKHARPPGPAPKPLRPKGPSPKHARPPGPAPKPVYSPGPDVKPFLPRCLRYATYDEPRYSRLLVVLEVKYRFQYWQFVPFGEIEDVWNLFGSAKYKTDYRGPVFVKYARSSQALRALEASAQIIGVIQIYLAQSRVPGKPYELDMDLQKLTVIHVRIPRFFTENVLANKFKVYGTIVSSSIIKKEVGESKDSAFIRFSKASEAALAIEECDKKFEAVWAEANPDLPIPPDLKFDVFGAKQGKTKHEIQEAIFNAIGKSTSLANEPSKVSESKSPVNNPKEKTTCKEVQESSTNTLGKSTSEANLAIEPSKLSASKCDVNNSKPETTNNEIEKSSMNTSGKDTKCVKPAMKPAAPSESKLPETNPKHKTTNNKVEVSSSNTLGKDTKCVKPAMKPAAPSESKLPVTNPKHKTTNNKVEVSPSNILGKRTEQEQQTTSSSVICTEKKTISSEMQWSNSIPVVSRTTLNVPVTRTKSEPRRAVQNAIIQRIPGTNLTILVSADKTTSSEPTAKALESIVNYWVNRTEKKINVTSSVKSNLITLDSSFSEVPQVFNPPEHYGYAYGTHYSAALPEPSIQPSGTNLDYYHYTSGVEQQTDDHTVKESNLMSSGYSTHLPVSVTQPLEPNVCPIYESPVEPEVKGAEVQQETVLTTEKSLKSSEWKFYMGGARRKKRSQGNSLLTSVDPPDLASVERSNTRKQESISTHLLMVSEFPLAQEQIFGLFDVIPGLESCEVRPGLHSKRVYAMIQYRNVASAVYAKHRLHGLEYPLGNRLHITFIEDKIHGTELLQEMATQLVTSHLASVIWDNNWAPQLLRSAVRVLDASPPRIQTDAVLPSFKRKAPPDSSIRERLLITFDPCPLPQNVLDNVLSRFENFIASSLLPGKNGAYAMFAERASASEAIATLHGKTVNDVKLKVTLSDLPTEYFSKRQRLC